VTCRLWHLGPGRRDAAFAVHGRTEGPAKKHSTGPTLVHIAKSINHDVSNPLVRAVA
jgi:hypothetical protein